MNKEIIKATPNHGKRTFTIRKYFPGGGIVKYRTFDMSVDDFEDGLFNTPLDWSNFLRSSDGCYYRVN